MGIVRGIHFQDEDVYYKALHVAKALGYRSFSAFVCDLLREAVVMYEVAVKMKEAEERQLAKKAFSVSFIKKKLFAKK